MVQWDSESDQAVTKQVRCVLAANFVISFEEKPGDGFEPITERVPSVKGRIRKMPAGYLAYCLVDAIDAIADEYFGVLEHVGDKIEAVEFTLVSRPAPETLHDIHRLKRESLLLRKSVWPFREVINGLEQTESQLISTPAYIYLRDVYDHSLQVIQMMETFRDMPAATPETYLSSLSNRMNEVVKVLTIIATVFIPLTFVAGIYGMNLQHRPELQWRWGYWAVLLIMAFIAGGMILYFRRKRWL